MMGTGPKGPERFGASFNDQEVSMKLVTRFEAAARSTTELQGLLRKAFNVLVTGSQHTQERDNAKATIETIKAELSSRSR